jgi:integrase
MDASAPLSAPFKAASLEFSTMPRIAKAWFRKASNAWYATLNRQKISLGVQGEDNEAEAVKAWHRLMADGRTKPDATPKTASVQGVLDGFLADAEDRVSPECLRQYRKHLLRFGKRFGTRPADGITPAEAEAYARKPEWAASTRNGVLGSLVSAYRWAERSQVIARNPLQGVRKPPKASRGAKALVSAEAHATLCERAEPVFKAFLQLLWLTGARPGEIASLQGEEIDLKQGVAVLTEHKTAHLGKSRILFLSPEAVKIIQAMGKTEGLLFVGEDAQPLTANAIGSRLTRLCVKAGVKHCIAYGYRHTYATDALAKGVPDAQVAALMGHAGTAMLHKHYAHLTAKTKVLHDALASVRA